jgi:hypothetical protein
VAGAAPDATGTEGRSGTADAEIVFLVFLPLTVQGDFGSFVAAVAAGTVTAACLRDLGETVFIQPLGLVFHLSISELQ